MKASDRSGNEAPGAPAGLVLGARNKAGWHQPEARRSGLAVLRATDMLLEQSQLDPSRAVVRFLPAFRDATRVGHAHGTASLLWSGRYRNFVETESTWLGHNGYGGQWLVAYPESEIIVACLSGVTDDGGHDWRFVARLAAMGETIAALLGNGS
jgi:CubicO group peptidase (beta-lactamase class C family)